MPDKTIDLLNSILEHQAEIDHDLEMIRTITSEDLAEDLEQLQLHSRAIAKRAARLAADQSRQETVNFEQEF
jgi:predicted DNA-binding ArsR family transcriptional regulator